MYWNKYNKENNQSKKQSMERNLLDLLEDEISSTGNLFGKLTEENLYKETEAYNILFNAQKEMIEISEALKPSLVSYSDNNLYKCMYGKGEDSASIGRSGYEPTGAGDAQTGAVYNLLG